MTLREKLTLFKQILLNDSTYWDNFISQALIDREVKRLTNENELLIKENEDLVLEIEKMKNADENIRVISSKSSSKIKLVKPEKIVIVKYSLPINKERTHIGAFTKKDLLYLIRDYSYNRREYGVGYILEGVFDRALRGLLNEYGEKYDYFIDDKNNEYTSNILIYDYLTLPQVLDLMDLPVDLNISGVTLEVVNAAVKYSKLREEHLFNDKLSKKRRTIRSKL